jgi:hypothetical protein
MERGKMTLRKYPTEMIIFVPVDTDIQKVVIVLRNAHNHPMHPRTKPTQADKLQLISAVEAAGKTGLTV